jgi:hypothetical protein
VKVSANLGWGVVVATLVMIIGLGAILPPSDSGPANAGRFVIGVWLLGCLLLTLVAWAARGRWRALVVWIAAAPIWLWVVYILVASFIWPDPDKSGMAYFVGTEVVLAVIAGAITAIGVLFWRAKPVNAVATDAHQATPL